MSKVRAWNLWSGTRARQRQIKRGGLPPPTKVQQRWHDWQREYGCFVCRHWYGLYTPPSIHHLLEGGRRVSHNHTIPLCPRHHQYGGDGWESRHSHMGKSGRAAFDAAYRSDWEMLEYISAVFLEDWALLATLEPPPVPYTPETVE